MQNNDYLESKNVSTINARKGFSGVIKKPTNVIVGDSGPEIISVKPLKKFTSKTKNLPKFNSDKSKLPKLNLDKNSYSPKKAKVKIVKKLPKANLEYPKMTDIFDVKEPKAKMPKNNYSMGMPKGKDIFDSIPKEKSKNSNYGIFPKMDDIFDMPKHNSKGFNMGVAKNIFEIDDSSFDSTSKKAKKFYGKVKGKKLDNLGGFEDWGKQDDWTEGFKLGF